MELSELYRVLRVWFLDALELHVSNQEHVVTVRNDNWVAIQPGVFQKGVDCRYWDSSLREEALALESFQEVTGYLAVDERVAKHFGNLVGTIKAGTRWEVADVCLDFLPSPDEMRLPRSEIECSFDSKFRRLERGVLSETVDCVEVFALEGRLLKGESTQFGKHAVLRTLSDGEIVDALNMGAFRRGPITYLKNDGLCGLVVSHTLEKRIGDFSSNYDQGMSVSILMHEASQTAKVALALAGCFSEFSASVSYSSLFPYRNGGGSSYNYRSVLHPKHIERDVLESAVQMYDCLQHAAEKAKSLRLAADRLTVADSRLDSVDRILDVVIAAEALYISSHSSDRSELSFRAALYAAMWHELSPGGLERRDVFKYVYAAYRARSKIVHGSSVSSEKVGNVAVPIRELTATVERVVKCGLIKALIECRATGAWAPDFLERFWCAFDRDVK